MAKHNFTNDKIVWIDMEMTGLDPNVCHIIEIACAVTDKDLTRISPVFNEVIHQPAEILNSMNDWCKEHHKKSGLIRECEMSEVDIKQVESKLLKFLKHHARPGGCPLAGNTVYMDKIFLMKYLPRVCEYLHYRIIDVSSVFELCRRWYPNFRGMQKTRQHRAKTDILESIAELKYLRKRYFVNGNHFLTNNDDVPEDSPPHSSDLLGT